MRARSCPLWLALWLALGCKASALIGETATSSGGNGGAGGGSTSGGAQATAGDGGATGGAATRPDCLGLVTPHPQVAQALPRAVVDVTFASVTGQSFSVTSSAELRVALDQAAPGDEIVLAAGATFEGPITLPSKPGNDWITLRTSALAALPAAGTRVRPADAAFMPRITVAPGQGPALSAGAGAHHFRLVGLEIAPVPGSSAEELVELGTGAFAVLDQASHHLVVDRCYIHGDPSQGAIRGVALNAADSAIVDSYLADFKARDDDAQAVIGLGGPGPFALLDNHLEGASDNILFGTDGASAGAVPSDITICGNDLLKPPAWQSDGWRVRSLLNLASAERVLFAGNVLENTWADATAFALLVRNPNDDAPWAVVSDVTVAFNQSRNASSCLDLHNSDDAALSQTSARFVISHNLFDDVGLNQPAGNGRCMQMLSSRASDPLLGLSIEHNTVLSEADTLLLAGELPSAPVADGFLFNDNLLLGGKYGIIGSGTAEGSASLAAYFTAYGFRGNVLIGRPASVYPTNNFFPASTSDVGFVDAASHDYRLGATSPYRAAASDGADVGADIAAIVRATASVVDTN